LDINVNDAEIKTLIYQLQSNFQGGILMLRFEPCLHCGKFYRCPDCEMELEKEILSSRDKFSDGMSSDFTNGKDSE
jgi:pyrimidine deaminase RibD-like protein